MCELVFDYCFFVLYFNFLGMIIGFLIKYIGGENRVSITQPNCTITSATKKLYISAVNGSKYSYTLTGEVIKANDDQGSELEQKVRITVTLHTSQAAHQARAYLCFCSMKRLGIFLLPPG